MLGLRYTFLSDPWQWLKDGTIEWLWAEAKKAGVPIAALATNSLTELGRIAERHSALRLTIDHLGGRGGLTTLKDAGAMVHMPALLALAKFPNVAVKATGAPGYSGEAYPFPAMQTYVRQLSAFGPHRMFWGTDISKMPCSWGQCVTMFTAELPWLDDRDKKLVMGDALCDWWGWDRTGFVHCARPWSEQGGARKARFRLPSWCRPPVAALLWVRWLRTSPGRARIMTKTERRPARLFSGSAGAARTAVAFAVSNYGDDGMVDGHAPGTKKRPGTPGLFCNLGNGLAAAGCGGGCAVCCSDAPDRAASAWLALFELSDASLFAAQADPYAATDSLGASLVRTQRPYQG